MNYELNSPKDTELKSSFRSALQRLAPFVSDETRHIVTAFLAVIVNTVSNLIAPLLVAYTIDHYVMAKDFSGVLRFSLFLAVVFFIGVIANYIQIQTMGWVGRRVLFKLRNTLFNKIQSLPVAFFNQNKAGDLISRINNDTDKLNQFFSQALVQFVGSVVLLAGVGVFLLFLNLNLAIACLMPALLVLLITRWTSSWVRRRNKKSLESTGGLSAEIQESLANFKVIVAFNRLDYFREKFHEANKRNFEASIDAWIATNIFIPLYQFASTLWQLVTLIYGIYLIRTGNLTIGLLVGFFLYVNNFYSPLRQIAAMWSSLQLALASIDRISEVLVLESDMITVPTWKQEKGDAILEFRRVSFQYPNGNEILHDINFTLEKGKTYALVGPTWGGKTTTASLMARLYDPTHGTVFLDGQDIRSYTDERRAKKIGFILQEPFLFSGTLRDNLIYGNKEYLGYSDTELESILEKAGFRDLIARFEWWLDTPIIASDVISLGQKQLIAFMRAILRSPDLLILDEATANIDTVTEQLLESMLEKLPKSTTKVIIAHRLNTIKNADCIFFVNTGKVSMAGSMEHALDMILHWKRET